MIAMIYPNAQNKRRQMLAEPTSERRISNLPQVRAHAVRPSAGSYGVTIRVDG